MRVKSMPKLDLVLCGSRKKTEPSIMQDMPTIQCTSCRYCCEGCPMSIRIPDIFRTLNTARLYKKDNRPKMFYNNLNGARLRKASDCIGCR